MVTAYALCAIVGGVFVLVAALMGAGGHDADAHADFDAAEVDVEGELEVEASEPDLHVHVDTAHDLDDHAIGSWLPFLSVRFWTYGTAAFGVTGLLLTWLTQPRASITALLAAATGITAGTAMSWATLYLRRSQIHSGVSERDFMGAIGHVLTPVHPDHPGKVRCRINDELIDVIAIGAHEPTLPEGTEVVVTHYRDSRAIVAGTGLDALQEGKPGEREG